MKINERKNKIINLLTERNFVSVDELSKILYTSPSSIRRDLNALQSEGLVRRNYGGVMLFETKSAAPVSWRWEVQKSEKKAIAKKAAKHLQDYTTVFLDSSTTAYYLAEYIIQKKGITVITNNTKTAEKLFEGGINTYCIGGNMHSENVNCGSYAIEQLRQFHADTVFFSSFALADNGTVSDSCAEENEIRKIMLSQSDCKIFLCDSSKFHRTATHILCNIKDIDYCISDASHDIFTENGIL